MLFSPWSKSYKSYWKLLNHVWCERWGFTDRSWNEISHFLSLLNTFVFWHIGVCHSPVDFHTILAYPRSFLRLSTPIRAQSHSLMLTTACADARISMGEWKKPAYFHLLSFVLSELGPHRVSMGLACQLPSDCLEWYSMNFSRPARFRILLFVCGMVSLEFFSQHDA